LYVVATPIGNLDDISKRALQILGSVDLIACEDTRHTLKLLSHFNLQKPLTSYHDFNEDQKANQLARRVAQGETIALVSDAGIPTLSDPGYRLVRFCRQNKLPVIAVPGPNAAITALAASGLPSDEFVFLGFLPVKPTARREKLRSLRDLTPTLIFYEAPHRIQPALEDVLSVLGDREVCVGRELTKVHEEYVFGNLSEVISQVKPLGEFVIVLGGRTGESESRTQHRTREEVLQILGMSRNQLYDLFFKKPNALE
jgi:16S rRNA (cytidine1402-2'-O)-methyltransferase